jgi:hypothetical protein
MYKEAYVNANGLSMELISAAGRRSTLSGKENLVERMKDRRRDRVRERGSTGFFGSRWF